MMPLRRTTILRSVISFYTLCGCLFAQEPIPSTAPSLEQTIAFIQDRYVHEGAFVADSFLWRDQTIAIESGCSVRLRKTQIFQAPQPTTYVENATLDLAKSDLASLSLETIKGDTFYRLKLGKASYTHHPPDVVGREEIHYTAKSLSEHPFTTSGDLVATSDGSMTVVSPGGIEVHITFDKVPLLFWTGSPMDESTFARISFSDFKVGDFVSVTPQLKKGGDGKEIIKNGSFVRDGTIGVLRYTKPSPLVERALGVFHDKDTAERVAKAFVHAMALCHAADKPLLF